MEVTGGTATESFPSTKTYCPSLNKRKIQVGHPRETSFSPWSQNLRQSHPKREQGRRSRFWVRQTVFVKEVVWIVLRSKVYGLRLLPEVCNLEKTLFEQEINGRGRQLKLTDVRPIFFYESYTIPFKPLFIEKTRVGQKVLNLN